MKSELSALVDGELESHEAEAAFARLRRDDGLRLNWDEYQVIGAALRREDRLTTALTARVMAGLEHEVTVLAPRPRVATDWQRPLMALAASLAGVVVVGWVAFSPHLAPAPAGSGHLAAASPGQSGVMNAAAAAVPVAQQQMQEYLVAHQAYVSGSQMVGGTQHIRTVSVAEGGPRR